MPPRSLKARNRIALAATSAIGDRSRAARRRRYAPWRLPGVGNSLEKIAEVIGEDRYPIWGAGEGPNCEAEMKRWSLFGVLRNDAIVPDIHTLDACAATAIELTENDFRRPARPRPPRLERTARLLLARAAGRVRRRSLISHILVAQLAFAAAAGVVALAGLWWMSSALIRDDMREWGAQWLDNLDQLGVSLYLPPERRTYARADAYIEEFAEVLFVRYYSATGELLFTASAHGGAPSIAPIDALSLDETSRRSTEPGHVLDTAFRERSIVRVAKPIWWTGEDYGLEARPAVGTADGTLLGYVELGLDFGRERAYLTRLREAAIALGACLLVLLCVSSWLVYRRALRPLSALQAPLQELARGRTDVCVDARGHREIVAIANAVNTTANALDERDKRLTRLAHDDALTGLINRATFSDLLELEVERAASSGRMGALLLVDLDQFKYVNDALGHVVGDDLLKLVAQRLAANVRPQDIVARFGGDEFSVLLTDVGRKEAAAACAELVKRVQEEPFVVGGRSLSLRCSVGATMIRGTRAPATLLSQADMACHQAKASGRNQFQFYKTSSSEVAEMNADAAWLQDIQAALKTDAFVLHYQPIVEIGSRRTAYYEVLLRKRGGGRELVAPGAFIPAATRLGLMTELDQWVVRHALRTLGEVRGSRSDVRFTLNVSGSTFERPDFFDYLENELRCSGVPPNAIVIEITEQIAVRNLGATARQMAALVDRGCGFAIDDFGSGYCSYNYLKELPVAFVKIDGSFVVNLAGDPVDQKIVGAISEVATATGCKTIAEHVENHRTLRLLERLGVTYAQGYFLGKPSARVGDERFAAATLRPPRRRAN